jgi:hypothetical protein
MGSGRDPEKGRAGRPDNVVPFAQPGCDDKPWVFTSDGRHVDGAEAVWLQKELAKAVRNLLLWARKDMSSAGPDEHNGEQAAA